MYNSVQQIIATLLSLSFEGAEAMRADRHSWLERRAALSAAASAEV